MRCTDVAPSALGLAATAGPAGELALEFDPRGRLVDATTFRSHLSPEAASATAGEIATALGRTLGDPARKTGSFDAVHLSQAAAESIATLSYRYGDYVADVTAMRLPSGVTVREQYMSARD